MYLILNILVFGVLSLYALRILFSKASYVKFTKDQYILLTAPEKFLLLTMVTGMIAVTGGGLSSLRLMWWIILVLLGFIVYRKNIKLNTFIFVSFIFLGYTLVTLIWSPSLSYGFRMFLKYLYPVLIMLFAMSFVTNKMFIYVAIKYIVIISFVLSILLGGLLTDVLGIWFFYFGGVFWPPATLADYLAVMSAVSFVLWWKTGEKKYLFLIVWFLISCMLQSIRTGLLSITIMITFGLYLRYRFISIPYVLSIIILGLSLILFIPSVKEKMFFDTSNINTIEDVVTNLKSDDNVNNSGRKIIWTIILDKFYKGNELLGSGMGSSQQFMYENSHLFPNNINVTHNDFVQMLCDIGKLGIILYLMIPFTFLILNWKYFRNPKDSELSLIANMAILSYIAILPAMNFDNVVNYSFPVHSMPFIFIGLFYAQRRILERENNNV